MILKIIRLIKNNLLSNRLWFNFEIKRSKLKLINKDMINNHISLHLEKSSLTSRLATLYFIING